MALSIHRIESPPQSGKTALAKALVNGQGFQSWSAALILPTANSVRDFQRRHRAVSGYTLHANRFLHIINRPGASIPALVVIDDAAQADPELIDAITKRLAEVSVTKPYHIHVFLIRNYIASEEIDPRAAL